MVAGPFSYLRKVVSRGYRHDMKPYTTKLNVSGCVPGTMLWFDHTGKNCVAQHPGYACDQGWMETVMDYRQWWGRNGYRGTWINGRLYMGNCQLQVVVGAGVKA